MISTTKETSNQERKLKVVYNIPDEPAESLFGDETVNVELFKAVTPYYSNGMVYGRSINTTRYPAKMSRNYILGKTCVAPVIKMCGFNGRERSLQTRFIVSGNFLDLLAKTRDRSSILIYRGYAKVSILSLSSRMCSPRMLSMNQSQRESVIDNSYRWNVDDIFDFWRAEYHRHGIDPFPKKKKEESLIAPLTFGIGRINDELKDRGITDSIIFMDQNGEKETKEESLKNFFSIPREHVTNSYSVSNFTPVEPMYLRVNFDTLIPSQTEFIRKE